MAEPTEWTLRLRDNAGAEVCVGATMDVSGAPVSALGGPVRAGVLGEVAARWEHGAPVVLRAFDEVTITSLAGCRATVVFHTETLAEVRARTMEAPVPAAPGPKPRGRRAKAGAQ